MRVFLTGASGFIGLRLVPELISAGHEVVGLIRTGSGAEALARAGAEALRGDLHDFSSWRATAADADAIIHTAFDHDLSAVHRHSEADRRAIDALGALLTGSDRPLIVTSGTGLARSSRGGPAQETDPAATSEDVPRAATEEAAARLADQGVKVMVMRLSQVHDTRRQGRISLHVDLARLNGRAVWVGEGANRVAAVHVSDAVRLYRLALEKGKAGARFHAVAEEGVTLRRIAETIGARLGVPAQAISPDAAPAYFGALAGLVTLDLAASSTWTRQALGWSPVGPDLLSDLAALDEGPH